MDFVPVYKKINENQWLKPKDNKNNLNELISLLNEILILKEYDPMILDSFQVSVIKALKEEKEKKLQKPQNNLDQPSVSQVDYYTQALNALIPLKYLNQIDVKIIGDNIVFSNKDHNDVFRLCFVGFAFNMALNPELKPSCRFTTLNYGERKRYVMDHLAKPTTQIVTLNKMVNPENTIPVVFKILEDLIDIAKNYEGNYMGLSQYLITKIQDPCVDFAIVSYMRSIVFEAPSDNTPPFEELKDITSEFYSKKFNKRPLHDTPEFWWKVANALMCNIYLSEENLKPKSLGYPRIPDGLLLLPDIYFIRESDVIKYKIVPNYKPFISKIVKLKLTKA